MATECAVRDPIQTTDKQPAPFPASISTDAEIAARQYSLAPDYNRKKMDKYNLLLNRFDGLRGSALHAEIAAWNESNPDFRTSYPMVMRARSGRISLLGAWGNRAGSSLVRDEWFESFRAYYLKEGAPSAGSCWYRVLGEAATADPSVTAEGFPSESAFMRRLNREVPESAQFLARYGRPKWNRRYGPYINRNYESIAAGKCWVADHAQIDVAVLCDDGRVRFPWVTAWRDFRTSKWLGWSLHWQDPNSDWIFLAFYYAARNHGLCDDVLIDNGKDFRCRDFAGTRRLRVSLDETKTVSMLSLLGITPHFALPYNAQTKPIERDFLKVKELFSKHMAGYRGGNPTEKPEILKEEIRSGRIMAFASFCGAFDDFIENVLNKCPSQGKNLLGRSPDAAWAEEFTEKREVSAEALRLFCMRTSQPASIGRNGVSDSELGVLYWGEWMAACKGRRVYLRRDLKDYATATVWDAETDEYIGDCRAGVFDAPALAQTEVSKEEFKQAIAAKRSAQKIEFAYARNRAAGTDPFEQLVALKAGIDAAAGAAAEAAPKIHRLANTVMDKVAEKRAAAQREDPSMYMRDSSGRNDSDYLFESDMKQAV